MITVDISKDYLEFFMAKKDIENMLIEEGEIDKPFEIKEFVDFINFGTHIYCKSPEETYPFEIIKTNSEEYLFIANVNKIDYKPLYDVLESIDYDFNNLTKKSQYDVVSDNLLYKPYFIIKKELYFDLRNK